MNWNDIEAKWAAMTRRVQSDWPLDGDGTVFTRALAPALMPQDQAPEFSATAPLDRPTT